MPWDWRDILWLDLGAGLGIGGILWSDLEANSGIGGILSLCPGLGSSQGQGVSPSPWSWG